MPRSRPLLVLALLTLAVACNSQPLPPPSPSSTPSPGPTASPGATPQSTPPAKTVGSLALEACDPLGQLACGNQAVFLTRPILGTGVALTISTEWVQGRLDRPEWDATDLGLGGWSLNVLQRYDPANNALLNGDGSWRIVEARELGNGERAIPSFDALQVYVFDAEWRHVRTLDDITGTTLLTFIYDADGRLAGATGSVEGAPVDLSITRGVDGHSLRLLGIAGAETRALTDERDNLVEIVTATGAALRITPGPWGLIDAWQNVGGQPTEYSYDSVGRLATATDADAVTTRFERTDDAAAFAVIVTTALGRVTTVRHETVAGSSVRSLTSPSGLTTRLEIASDGARTVTYPDGTVTSVGSEPHPRWGAAAGIPTPYVERRPDGSVHRQEIGALVATGPGEEPYGRAWTKEVLVDGQRWVQSYDPALMTLTWVDPAGRTTADTFDEAGRAVIRVRPGAPTKSLAYDADGRLLSSTEGSGPTQMVTTFAHDPLTGDIRITRPDGSVAIQGFDGNGRVVRNTAADGSAISSGFDAQGRLIRVRYGDHPSTTLGYSPAGRPTAFLPPIVATDQSYELLSYDEDGNISTVAGPGDRSVAYSYDEGGRVAAWQFDRGDVSAAYDPVTGHLVGLTAPGPVDTTMAYDGLSVSIAWSGPVAGRVVLTLDAGNRLSGERVNDADPIAYEHDEAGYLVAADALSFAVGLQGLPASSTMGVVDTAWTYDAFGRPVEALTTTGGNVVYRLTYERDSLGRVSAIERTEPGGTVGRTVYRYDDADRLSAVTVDDEEVETYAYDAAGNRISVSRASGAANSAYDDRDRLLTSGPETYEYAGDGTLTERDGADGSTTYDYDDLGALRSTVLPDGRRVDYVVDGAGRRIGRTVDGVVIAGYLYRPGGPLVAEIDGAGTVIARFAYDDRNRLISMSRGGRTYRIVTDHLGSPVMIIDSETGEVAQQVQYDVWGLVLADSSPGFTPFGFAGGLQDPDTGLVLFGARDYDPAAGRWTGPDPIRFAGGDPNFYRYAGDDPVNYIDSTGFYPCMPVEHPAECTGGNLPPPPGPSKPSGPPPACLGYPHGCDPAYPYFPPTPPVPPAPPPPRGPSCVEYPKDCNPNYPFPASRTPTPPVSTPPPTPPGSGAPRWWGGDFNKGFCLGYCNGYEDPGATGSGYCLGLCSPAEGRGICLAFCSYGDPHLRTGDGLAFDFQSAGEFTISRSPDGATDVQARQEPPSGTTTITLTTAVAFLVAGDRIGIYADDERMLIINGDVQVGNDLSVRLAGGGVVERHGSEVGVTWPDGARMIVHRFGYFMNYDFTPSPADAPLVAGVLGNSDGDVSNDLTTSTGVALNPDEAGFFDRLHHEFADSWRITQADSLFDYLPTQTTDTFTRREIPTAPATLADVEFGARLAAESLCRAVGVKSEPTLTTCILDVGLTGDPTFAGSAAEVAAGTDSSTTPPSTDALDITVDSVIEGDLRSAGDVVRYRFESPATQIVYLDAQGECVDGLLWRLIRPDGNAASISASCQDLGRQVLQAAGNWIVEFDSDTAAVGSFSFVIDSVPSDTQSDLSVGGEAAGEIEAIGARHRYSFTATAGQTVFLDAQGDCVNGLLWRLIGPDGNAVSVSASCQDLGRQVLPAAGNWIVELYSDTTAVGAFAFAVLPVQQDTQAIVAIGSTTSGEVETIGARHRYSFTATAGQTVFLDAQGDCVNGLLWRLIGPDGNAVSVSASCQDLGRQTLPVSGDWTVEFYSDTTAVGGFVFAILPDG